MSVGTNFDGSIQEALESDEKLNEIRPGRSLFCRNVLLRKGISNNTCSKHNKICDVLFVHGSCAASSQFDSLLCSMKNLIQEDNDISDGVKIGCFLFDTFGFGKSTNHPSADWNAFSETELALDLKMITLTIFEKKDFSNNLFIVAHSYGPSQVIKLINSLNDGDVESKIRGIVFISGGLKDGPGSLTKDGGHWIWHYIPTFLLRRLQPSLNEEFLKAAIHPDYQDRLRESALQICASNDMAICKAFYRQQRYATSKDAQKIKIKTIVIHGEDDKIIPVEGGAHLSESLLNSSFHVITGSSHQVFEEKPDEIGRIIITLIKRAIN